MDNKILDITSKITEKRCAEITDDVMEKILPMVLEAAIPDAHLRSRYMDRYFDVFKNIFPRASFVINRSGIPEEIKAEIEQDMQRFMVNENIKLVTAIIAYQCDILELLEKVELLGG